MGLSNLQWPGSQFSTHDFTATSVEAELEQTRRERDALDRAAGLLSAATLDVINSRKKALEQHARASRNRNEAIRQAAARAVRASAVHCDPAHITAAARVSTARAQYLEAVRHLYPAWARVAQHATENVAPNLPNAQSEGTHRPGQKKLFDANKLRQSLQVLMDRHAVNGTSSAAFPPPGPSNFPQTSPPASLRPHDAVAPADGGCVAAWGGSRSHTAPSGGNVAVAPSSQLYMMVDATTGLPIGPLPAASQPATAADLAAVGDGDRLRIADIQVQAEPPRSVEAVAVAALSTASATALAVVTAPDHGAAAQVSASAASPHGVPCAVPDAHGDSLFGNELCLAGAVGGVRQTDLGTPFREPKARQWVQNPLGCAEGQFGAVSDAAALVSAESSPAVGEISLQPSPEPSAQFCSPLPVDAAAGARGLKSSQGGSIHELDLWQEEAACDEQQPRGGCFQDGRRGLVYGADVSDGDSQTGSGSSAQAVDLAPDDSVVSSLSSEWGDAAALARQRLEYEIRTRHSGNAAAAPGQHDAMLGERAEGLSIGQHSASHQGDGGAARGVEFEAHFGRDAAREPTLWGGAGRERLTARDSSEAAGAAAGPNAGGRGDALDVLLKEDSVASTEGHNVGADDYVTGPPVSSKHGEGGHGLHDRGGEGCQFQRGRQDLLPEYAKSPRHAGVMARGVANVNMSVDPASQQSEQPAHKVPRAAASSPAKLGEDDAGLESSVSFAPRSSNSQYIEGISPVVSNALMLSNDEFEDSFKLHTRDTHSVPARYQQRTQAVSNDADDDDFDF